MNKTVNVNIGGSAFILDEDAYLMLRSYLNQIEVRLAPSLKRDTLEDLETRIADIFTDNIGPRNQVISTTMVRKAISIIGSAEEFGEPAYKAESYENATIPPPAEPVKRRLYRSRDKILGGVCGGMAEYFDTDPSILRIIAAILLVFGGVGFLIYIIMWIVVPLEPRNTETDKKSKYNERR